MTVIVTDTGFAQDDWRGEIIDLPSDTAPEALPVPPANALVRIAFPSPADGRGFTLARLVRQRGFGGRLRAAGYLIADQYAMARRSGFDEVEIDAGIAARQPEDQWRLRADTWRAHDYQARLRG
jgi:uncharacterized protein (DUF934 family)